MQAVRLWKFLQMINSMRKPTASHDKKVNTEKTDETLHQPNYYHLDSFSGSRIQLEQSISRQPPGCRRPCQTQPAHSCSHRQQSHENNKEKRSPEEGRKKNPSLPRAFPMSRLKNASSYSERDDEKWNLPYRISVDDIMTFHIGCNHPWQSIHLKGVKEIY